MSVHVDSRVQRHIATRRAPSRNDKASVSTPRDTAPSKPTTEDAHRIARRRVLAGQRIDMRALASELGVSRATLYRWTGPREHLLGNVLGRLAEETFELCKREAPGTGATRIINVFDRHLAMIAKAPALRRFLETDAETALRVLTMRDGPVQGRLVRAHTELLREEAQRGRYIPRVDAAALAYAIVRIGEAFLYNDAIIALEPDLEQAGAIVRLLLD